MKEAHESEMTTSELEEILYSKYGIDVRLYEENPGYVGEVWVPTKQQPLHGIEREVAEYLAEKENITLLKIDRSKHGKPEYSEFEHAWATKIRANSIEELENGVKEFRKKAGELDKKVEEAFWKVVNELLKELPKKEPEEPWFVKYLKGEK